MAQFADLSLRVTSFDYQPVQGARVTAEREGRVIATGATDDMGRCQIERDDDGELLVRVEAPGFAGDQRVVTGDRPEDVELFMLGRPGMPFYYRGKVRVPFEPVPDAVGVVMRELGQGIEDDVAARADGVAQGVGASVIRSGANFARSGIAVLGLSPDATGGGPTSIEALLNQVAESDEVEQAGALVKLFGDNASFLTDIVIARFTEGVDDAAVAAIAARHGFTPVGRVGALGNVHRLRRAGPATYAVLDASNALADEPEVVYAEPDLVHTVEEDQVIPTDFLFPQQWDHPIIDTPKAWQALRDLDVNRTFGSPDVIIAVVDSGVDATHPEFAGNVSNGQPKLYRVFDFTNMVANMNNLAGDHGTACASAATASANNGSTVPGVSEGIAGVAGNCRLIGVRQGGAESRYAEMYLWTAGLNANSSTAGFPAQIAPGADVITNSFGSSIGSPISGLMSDTFDTLTDDGRGGRGTLLFFSAGNDNTDLDVTFARPWGMYERCFCVAASTLDDDGVTEIKAKYSSFGSTVDFCAPSNDSEGIHNPPTAYGANAATIQATPGGDAIPGRPERQTTLSAAAAAGTTSLTLATAAGMATGQAMLIGASGAAGTEGRRITAVNAGTNQITVTPPLRVAHGVGTVVASGPRSYQSGFGGTSYATPVCAGTGALMLSANPLLRWDQVRDILRNTAIKIDPNNTDPTGRWRDGGGRISTDPGYAGPLVSEFFGFGRVDASAAVRAALRIVPISIDPRAGFVKLRNTPGTVEVHWDVLSGNSYKRKGDFTSSFSPADADNGIWQLFGSTDGAPMLGFVKLRNTPGTVEVHWDVLSGNSYKRKGDFTSSFSPADADNGIWQLFGSTDGAPMLGFVKLRNTPGTVEVHWDVLSGNSYKRKGDFTSSFSPADADNGIWQLFGSTDGAPMLGFVKLRNTPGTVEVHWDVLSGNSYKRKGDFTSSFSPADADNGIWQLFGSTDGAPMLGFVKLRNTPGTVEVHWDVLSGNSYKRKGDFTSSFGPADADNGVWNLHAP